MFQKVLFATDFSECSYVDFECIPGIKGIGKMIVLHVLDPLRVPKSQLRIEEEKAKAKLLEVVERLERAGLNLKPYVKFGMPSTEILGVAEEEDEQLIVVGARGRSLLRRAFLGSTSSDVLRRSRIPLLIIRNKIVEEAGRTRCIAIVREPFKRMLLATDFSEHSRAAFEQVKALKSQGLEEVSLVHVVDRGETAKEIGGSSKRRQSLSFEKWRKSLKTW